MTEEELVSRRNFLGKVSLALSGVAAAVVSVPIVAYLLSPLLQPPPEEWRDLGPIDVFKIGETVEVAYDEPSPLPWAGQTARTAVWLRRTGERDFTAFGLNCSHLGCPVNWRPGADLFLCPCHGGVYYADGSVAGGPPPRPLTRYSIRIANTGQVQVLTKPLAQSISQG
jgi:quinol---cytochrome c reductase iron-sulfur subunit, bacillus type